MTAATIFGQYLLRQSGILTPEEKKELKLLLPEMPKQKTKNKKTNSGKGYIGKKLEKEVKQVDKKLHKNESKVSKAIGKLFHEKLMKPKTKARGAPIKVGLADNSGSWTGHTVEGKGRMDQKVPIATTRTFLNGQPTLPFTAGQVLGFIPLCVKPGSFPQPQWMIDTVYAAKMIQLPQMQIRRANDYLYWTVDKFEIAFESSTPPASTTASGKLAFAYIPDITQLGSLESGDKLLQVLSTGPFQFTSIPLWDPDYRKTSYRPKLVVSSDRNHGMMLTSPISANGNTAPAMADYLDRCMGCVIILCEQDFNIGSSQVTFDLWCDVKLRFKNNLLQDVYPSNDVVQGANSTAPSASIQAIFNGSTPKYNTQNALDLRLTWQANKNSNVAVNPTSAYSFNLANLCGPSESCVILLNVPITSITTQPVILGFNVAPGSGVTTREQTNQISPYLSTGVQTTASIYAILTPTTSPCWVTPYYQAPGAGTWSVGTNAFISFIVKNNVTVTSTFVNATHTEVTEFDGSYGKVVNKKDYKQEIAQMKQDLLSELLPALKISKTEEFSIFSSATPTNHSDDDYYSEYVIETFGYYIEPVGDSKEKVMSSPAFRQWLKDRYRKESESSKKKGQLVEA